MEAQAGPLWDVGAKADVAAAFRLGTAPEAAGYLEISLEV